jgi:hypothetical protein
MLANEPGNMAKIGVRTAASVVAIALVQGVLSLLRVSVILDAYGDKINGIVQVALQLSTYLVLFQSGMSAAYQFKMYEPLSEGQFGRISALFSGLQHSMRRVTVKMLLASLVIIPVYSALLLYQGVRYWDTVLILAVIGLRVCAPYFYTLPERCLIDIKERKYIVNIVEGVKDIATLCVEILLVWLTTLPLPLILCVNFIFIAATKFVYLAIIRRYYGPGFVQKCAPEYAPPHMTRAVYVHQISSIATSNTNSVVLSLLSTLKNVTIYSAFATVIAYPSLVVLRIVEGMRASLALKITRGDEDSFQAFKELMAFSLCCVCLAVPVFLQMANPFVNLWIGAQYEIPAIPLVLFALLLADSFFMPVIYAARDARGLYRESQGYTVVQAVVNVVLSVGLAIPFGIVGVLLGTFAAAYLVLQPCNFRLVYRTVFNRRMTLYWELLLVAVICAASYFASGLVYDSLFAKSGGGWMVFIEETLLCIAVSAAFAFAGLWFFYEGFRPLIRRFFKRKKQAKQ